MINKQRIMENEGAIKNLAFSVEKAKRALARYNELPGKEEKVLQIGKSMVGYVENLISKLIRDEKLTEAEIIMYDNAYFICLTLDDITYWAKRIEEPINEEILKVLGIKV